MRVAAQENGNVTAPTPSDGGGPFEFLTHLVGWLDKSENLILVRLIATAIVIVAALVLTRFLRRHLRLAAERAARRNRLDDWQTRALVSRTRPLSMFVALVVYVAATAILLATWQLQTAFISLMTAAGFAGIVIGIAAASSLSNLIAGFMIFYNHPFDIGDWVEIEDVQGIVVDVKPGATVIESWDGEKVTFPNRIIDSSKIRNKSHQRKLRIRLAVGIDYATDIEKAREILLDIIKSHPEVLKDPEPQIIAMEFGDSSIKLESRYWIQPLRARVLLIQTWYMQEIQRAFAKEGIVIPFPQRTLVWRFPEGNAPPGETVSELAYDPAADARPFPSPPLAPPLDTTSPYVHQIRSPRVWVDRFLKRERRREPAPPPVQEEGTRAGTAASGQPTDEAERGGGGGPGGKGSSTPGGE